MKFNARTVYINDTQEADQLTRKQPDDYLKHYKRASFVAEKIFRAYQPLHCAYTYTCTRHRIFFPGTLLTIVAEREMERTRERKNRRGTRVYMYTAMERCKHTGADRFMRLSKCIFMHRFTAETSSLAASHFV